jgi:dihydroxyacetone kinase-like protein
MTSLDMMGASITIAAVDEELKELLTATADTPGLTV